MQLFIKCYLSKNFINLEKYHMLRWKNKSSKPHKLFQFCFNSQEQKYWEDNKSQHFESRLKKSNWANQRIWILSQQWESKDTLIFTARPAKIQELTTLAAKTLQPVKYKHKPSGRRLMSSLKTQISKTKTPKSKKIKILTITDWKTLNPAVKYTISKFYP